MIPLHHSDNRSGFGVCERCGARYALAESAWDLCREHLELELSKMETRELGDVPGVILDLFNLKQEYFRDPRL